MNDNTVAQRIIDLKCDLTSNVSDVGDWKIVKCYEYYLLDLPLPYDIQELHEKRQNLRDEINSLEETLANSENTGDTEDN